ncbi:YhcN/YlaJ family sporulation lipoprotein [Sporolactobacillus sp. CQH2019]|uniref:YhcN/YlaJ family sporulation lipoprotein n=1 Tax=Sporolactobacillus sp. CQH2019 TaxID=3023512 RepID=UPI002368DE50|nr:YhcN/YlaJ family sporulation lipoprotein [Sporolactobacillus sp. CQH2019]MDD9147681.1 YhcN/YlaJ family sporulation lipoprotein [Sporolactobacillus sp. CQH2019]
MKKAMSALGIMLMATGIFSGCRADNAANYNPNAPRDINYRVDRYSSNAAVTPNPITSAPTNYNATTRTNPANHLNVQSDRKLAKKIANKAKTVKGIAQAHVIVTNDSVVIGAVPDRGRTDTAKLRKEIVSAVRSLAGKRSVYVSTDNRYVQRITAVEANFNAGKGMREARADVVGIIDDLSRAVKRPFQNNTK